MYGILTTNATQNKRVSLIFQLIKQRIKQRNLNHFVDNACQCLSKLRNMRTAAQQYSRSKLNFRARFFVKLSIRVVAACDEFIVKLLWIPVFSPIISHPISLTRKHTMEAGSQEAATA